MRHLMLVAILGCSSPDTGSRPDAPVDAAVDAGVRVECTSPPTWTEPVLVTSPLYVRITWDEWVTCSKFDEASIAYANCYTFDFGQPAGCGDPPNHRGIPSGEPGTGTGDVVTFKPEDWDSYRAHVDTVISWQACVAALCPNGVCQ